MVSIYERLMNLPIFRGAGKELIDKIAASIPLEFRSFEPGDIIVRENKVSDGVISLLNGESQRRQVLCDGNLVVTEVIPPFCVVGLEHLFGLDNHHNVRLKALSQVGAMKISKQNYIKLIQSQGLLLLNYSNFLSRMAQNGQDALRRHDMMSGSSDLSCLLQLVMLPEALEVTLHTPRLNIDSFVRPPRTDGGTSLSRLEEEGYVIRIDDHTITIPSRLNLLEHFRTE